MSVQRQIEKLTVHRAAEWLEVLRMERKEEYPAFMQWITESPRHMDEFLKLLALSREARGVLHAADFDKSALLAQISPQVTEFQASSKRMVRGPDETARRVGWMAAAVLAIVVAALWVYTDLSQWKRYTTDVGEQRTISLADGSLVYLNAKSHVRVRLTNSSRDVQLLDGEALFNATHDARRPFRVHTHDVTVQAVGTQFDVTHRTAGIQVVVIEGKVQISSSKGTDTKTLPSVTRRQDLPPTMLTAGDSVRVSPKGAIEHLPSAEAANTVAWRQRRLIFESTSLEDVVEEFNRYRRSMPLRIDGIAPGSHHYSGTFDADDAESFISLLSHEHDLTIERRGDDIVIRQRPPHP